MKIDNRKILVVIVLVTPLLFPLVAFTTGTVRIALGLLFVLFFPGYMLLSALFPRRGDLGGIERVALSFGLSIAVVPLIGLILNYTPWGIGIYPVLISVALFILVTSAIAWYRQGRLPIGEQYSITVNISLPKWRQMGNLDKALSAALAVVILSALGFLVYFSAIPNRGERFTEFYILDAQGKTENYPTQVVLGEPVELIVGIVNHEYAETNYRITVRTNGFKNAEIFTGTLANNERWQERISFVPSGAGEGQKVELCLYKNNETQPYNNNSLYSYIDITPLPPTP